MESLGYVLVYMMLGKLPWQNLPAEENETKKQKVHISPILSCLSFPLSCFVYPFISLLFSSLLFLFCAFLFSSFSLLFTSHPFFPLFPLLSILFSLFTDPSLLFLYL
jgi:hypothetical protein